MKAGLDVGKKVALLDFQLLDEATKADADLFFRRFAAAVAEQLELPDKVDENVGRRLFESAELHALSAATHPEAAAFAVHIGDR